MDFKNKQVVRIAVISGTEGEYFPERFVAGRAKAFRLSAFERHDGLRPRREEFVMPWDLPELAQPAPQPLPQPSPLPAPAQPTNGKKQERKSAG